MNEEIVSPTRERLAKASPENVVRVVETSRGGLAKATGTKILSPLEELLHRDRIEAREFEAARRFYVDWYFTERPSQAVMRWQEFVQSGSSPGDLDQAERAAFHAKRFAGACQELGPYHGAVGRMLIVDELSLTQIGLRIFGFRSRNGAAAAGLAAAIGALDVLARFYRL